MKSRPGVTRKCCQTSWDIFLVLQIGLTICAMLKGGEGEMRIFHHIDRAGAERLSQSHILGPTDSRPDSSLTHRLTDSDWACPALHPWIQRRSPPPPPPKKGKRNARGDRIESPSSVRPSPSAPPFFSYSLPFLSLSVPFPPLPSPSSHYSNGCLRRDGRFESSNGVLAWETPLTSTRWHPFSAMKEGLT